MIELQKKKKPITIKFSGISRLACAGYIKANDVVACCSLSHDKNAKESH